MTLLKCLAVRSLVGILFGEKEKIQSCTIQMLLDKYQEIVTVRIVELSGKLLNVIGSMKRNNERHSVIN